MRIDRLLAGALALAMSAALWSGSAAAEGEKRSFWLTNTVDLLDLCTTPQDDPQYVEAINYCMAYMDGAVDYHDAITDHEELKRLICYPETATLEQGVLVFIDWAEANKGDEKKMNEPTIIGVVRALADKWPCQES